MTVKREKTKLSVEKRKTVGREVKFLRRKGILPANIYGKKIKSLAVQLSAKSFLPVLKEVGETGLLELKVTDEENVRPVLIHSVQFHPTSGEPLHADFYQVDLKEKVTTKVPVELIGESLAVKDKIGILIQPLSEVEVEALPADLPEKIEVDISGLKTIGDTILVETVKIAEGIKILTDGKEVLAKIEPPAKEEVVIAPVAEEVTAEGGETEKAGEETPKAGEKKPEETKTE
ncbi:MAG: 50S ribosomal protein L25 [Candidatus Shapirobacteria bacterium]|nr:50S ribosomal protein L25 [Candidatus Shapirobacteria bacterium]